jgi:hypothetical protein
MYQTESLVLFSRGDSVHSYAPGSFATEGAQNWVQNAEIGNDTPDNIAMQLEGFTASGCNKRVQKTQRSMYNAFLQQQ